MATRESVLNGMAVPAKSNRVRECVPLHNHEYETPHPRLNDAPSGLDVVGHPGGGETHMEFVDVHIAMLRKQVSVILYLNLP